MPGEIVTNPPTVPNTVSDSWQPLVERDIMSFYGMNEVTLTNWDVTLLAPAVAQGSAIDIDGSVARFPAEEAIGGSPSDGVIWLKFLVSGSDVTAEWTNETPVWYADKSGWYNAVGERFSGHYCTLAAGEYSDKGKLLDQEGSGGISLETGNLNLFGGIRHTGGLETVATYTNTVTDVIQPAGLLFIYCGASGEPTSRAEVRVQVFSSGSWVTISLINVYTGEVSNSDDIQPATVILSNGANVRISTVKGADASLTVRVIRATTA